MQVEIGQDAICPFRSTVALWDLPSQSGRTVARTGLRMMPTFPPSPLSFRTAGFPQYGWKAGVSDRAFPIRSPLTPAPGIRQLTLGLHPSFAHHVVRLGNPVLSRADDYVMRHLGVGLSSAPGALAPLRVILSRCINAYRPHPTHSQAHHDFAVYATYTQCLRCAGAPRRPGEWFRAFAAHSLLTCRPLCPRGDRKSRSSSLSHLRAGFSQLLLRVSTRKADGRRVGRAELFRPWRRPMSEIDFSRLLCVYLSLRPDDLLTILMMALSIDRDLVSLFPSIQATRFLTFTSVGLPPTEHISVPLSFLVVPELNLHGLLPCCVRFAPISHPVSGNTRY